MCLSGQGELGVIAGTVTIIIRRKGHGDLLLGKQTLPVVFFSSGWEETFTTAK